MESLAWEDYYIPLWYGRKGKFTDIDESRLVDPIDGVMWKVSSEWSPFLRKIENSITIECEVTSETVL